MKKIFSVLLCGVLLTGCTQQPPVETTLPQQTQPQVTQPVYEPPADARYLVLSDSGITMDGAAVSEAAAGVFISHDIIYYEDRDAYESGNPYGEGTAQERHSADEAAAHTVVNITAPGTYRVSGKLSRGQLRVDLGEDAAEDPTAVVTLILDNADITCTVAPAILYLNVYECDGGWSTDTATAQVDTTAAGANLMTAPGSVNHITGSHVARIYKDKEGEKKLWKQDGAIYAYMSMNVGGSGTLELDADNEGLDSELHLTIQSGNIHIRSGNDGINTNEDGVSVTTINGGFLHITAGLGAEGDGIDSNGYLVINGGTVIASAHPNADAGLDSDLGSYINGGTVIALGSAMDWAESDSDQVTMNLQFAANQAAGSAIVLTDPEGKAVFAYDPAQDAVLGQNARRYRGAIVSCPGLTLGSSYQLYVGGTLTGEAENGIFTTVTGYENGVQQAYTGTDVTMRPGGFGGQGGFGGGNRGDFPGGERPPKGDRPGKPEDERPDMPEGEMPSMPDGMTPPDGFGGGNWGGFSGGSQQSGGEANTLFYCQDKVNFFSGITSAK